MKIYIVAIITLVASFTLHASDDFRFDLGGDRDYPVNDNPIGQDDLPRLDSPCPKIYLPIVCEDEDGYVEEFTNECIATNAGYTFNCEFANERLY